MSADGGGKVSTDTTFNPRIHQGGRLSLGRQTHVDSPQRGIPTDQSKDCSQVRLGKLKSFYWGS